MNMNIIFTLTKEGECVGFVETTKDGNYIIVPDYARSGDVFSPKDHGFSIFRGRINSTFLIIVNKEDYSWQFLSLLQSKRLSPLNKALLLLGASDNRLCENQRRLLEIVDTCMGPDFQSINLTCKVEP